MTITSRFVSTCPEAETRGARSLLIPVVLMLASFGVSARHLGARAFEGKRARRPVVVRRTLNFSGCPASFRPGQSSSRGRLEMSMKTTMVRYRTTEAYAEANQAAIRAVYAELRRHPPPGLRYATHRLPDGVTFVHIASLLMPVADPHPLTSLPAFKAFVAALQGNCVEPPVSTDLHPFETFGDNLGGTGGQTT
jgi:hypothetical protein